MERLVQEAVAALAQWHSRYGRFGLTIDALIDAGPSNIAEVLPAWMAREDVAIAIWWTSYLHGAADMADMTVREMLDDYGISIEEALPALPAPDPVLPRSRKRRAG